MTMVAAPALYRLAADPARYGPDFFDVTVGNNQVTAGTAGFPATTGWDPDTGLGTPNGARLLPGLVGAL